MARAESHRGSCMRNTINFAVHLQVTDILIMSK